MSLEYIEKHINKYFQFNNLKIYKETDNKNESLYSLFNYIIKNNILEIYRNNEYMNNNYKIILNNPIKVENNELYNNIKNIYNKEFKLSSLSFYLTEEMKEYKIIKDNSVMITKSISGDYDLSDINKILENNTNKIKVILVYMISYNINQKSLIDFVNKNNIPIYTIDGNYYEKIIDFFIKGNNANYIFLYKNYQVYKKEDSIFSIFKLDLENNTIIQNNNPIENIIKNMSQYKLDKIKNNSSYKTELCMYYEDGRCRRKKNCDFAHGDYELDTVERIRDYFRKEKSEKTIKYEANIKKIFNDIKEESKNLFDILNLKLSKRLIYDILNLKSLKLSDLEYIFKDMNNIAYIYEVLCLEYYFNCEYNIFNKSLKEQLLNYFKKLSEDDKWIIFCFKQIEKMNYYQNELNESDFNLSNLNTEKKLLDKYYLCQYIFYDKITFLFEIIYKNNSVDFFVKYCLTVINKLLNNSLNKIERINYIQYNSAENYEFLILSKLINILYNYYINKINYKESSINIKELIIPNNIEETMKKLIKINLDEYFPNNNYKREDLLIRDNSRKKMSNQTASLIYFIFKYFDLYLLLFYRENFIQFYNIMINKENLLFKYYRDYKILSMQENKEKNNCKETVAFNYYIIEKMSNPDLIVNNNNTFEINANHINEYKLSNKNDIFDLTLKNIENTNYNKIIIYCKDDETNKYYYQDIIDLNKIFLSDNNYKFRVNKDIYLIPQKNIDTFLYSIENEKFIKYEEIPKFIWNIGFDGNNYLLIIL